MLVEKDIYDRIKNKHGIRMTKKYELKATNGDKIVIDHTAGLTWQQGGSEKAMSFDEAEDHIRELNQQKYGGCNDWRLPTLEEAMSLMKPSQKNGKLHIDSLFDQSQQVIWTSDKLSASHAWVVDFFHGGCEGYSVNDSSFVRAVH